MHNPLLSLKPRPLLLLVLIWVAGSLGAPAKDAAGNSVPLATASPATCPHRTVNYITLPLPRKCLNTSWSTWSTWKSSIVSSTSGQPDTGSTSSTGSASPATAERTSGVSSLSIAPSTASGAVPEEETDSESPLGKDNFLSFEEWKRRNLDKYGQSLDQVGKPKQHEQLQARRPPIDVLDALGDDPEIDLDFSAFASEKPQFAISNHQEARKAEQGGENRGKEIANVKSRSKDAGKTFKERFNYASFDCAATVLKTNLRSSGSSAVLVENKDSYMLNECSIENKFLILELCEDILIDTLVLANFEFFSSIFRTFTVSVSDRYPVKGDRWGNLGTFEARNTREVQAFLVENPMIWAKYVRVEFHTHYGNEFYCPVSLVRVHGTTMLEDYRRDEDRNKPEDGSEEDDRISGHAQQTDPVTVEAVAEILIKERNLEIGAQRGSPSPVQTSDQDDDDKKAKMVASPSPSPSLYSATPASPNSERLSLSATLRPPDLLQPQCLVEETGFGLGNAKTSQRKSSDTGTAPLCSQTASVTAVGNAPETSNVRQTMNSIPPTSSPSSTNSTSHKPSSRQASSTKSPTQISDRTTSPKSSGVVDADGTRPPATAAQPPAPNPTIQESFFKSVQKRLQMIEANSTLSLQYIEEQSRILRDAFSKVEQRQLSKTTNFLDYLNGTVLKELRDFRQQYDQLWQSTVIELETQRERSQREVVAMDTRLGILADEVVFQKRMAVLQSILVLFCIILVLFPRGAMNNYLDHPLVQNMLARSATFKTRTPFLETPSLSPVSSRPNSSYKAQAKFAYEALMGHQRSSSAESNDSPGHPAISYSPPTPSSYDGQSGLEDRDDTSTSGRSPPSPDLDSPHDPDPVNPQAAPRRAEESDDTKAVPIQPLRRRSVDDRSSPSPVSSVRFVEDSPTLSPSEGTPTTPSRPHLQVPDG